MSGLKKSGMEDIWLKLPKNKDGRTVTYIAADIPYLYNSGFVDTQTFTLAQWQNAFAPYLTPVGTYVLDREQFLRLDPFRYKAPVEGAYDPFKLRDGAWPDYELAYLWKSSIRPSSTIPFEVFEQSVELLKKNGKVNAQGWLVIDADVKKHLSYLLDKFPSPRRKREKEVERLRQKRGQKIAAVQKNRDSSSFTIGQTQIEAKKEKLADLQASQTAKKSQPPRPEKEPAGLDLKSLKKPGKKFRG